MDTYRQKRNEAARAARAWCRDRRLIDRILRLQECNEPLDILIRMNQAHEEGMIGITTIVEAGLEAGLYDAGLWICAGCGRVTIDPATGYGSETRILADDTILCGTCHVQAREARAKIVVSEDDEGNFEEDDSALTSRQRHLACMLDNAVEARNRQDRELIRMYPRYERAQLHRYQDDIDHDRRVSVKSKR
jgi:hypothetical protein